MERRDTHFSAPSQNRSCNSKVSQSLCSCLATRGFEWCPIVKCVKDTCRLCTQSIVPPLLVTALHICLGRTIPLSLSALYFGTPQGWSSQSGHQSIYKSHLLVTGMGTCCSYVQRESTRLMKKPTTEAMLGGVVGV